MMMTPTGNRQVDKQLLTSQKFWWQYHPLYCNWKIGWWWGSSTLWWGWSPSLCNLPAAADFVVQGLAGLTSCCLAPSPPWWWWLFPSALSFASILTVTLLSWWNRITSNSFGVGLLNDDNDSEDVDEGSDDDEGRPDRQTVEPPWQRIKHLAAAHLSTQEQTCQPKSNLTVKQDCQPKSRVIPWCIIWDGQSSLMKNIKIHQLEIMINPQ